MTSSRFRRRQQPAFNGDFPDDGQAATEVIGRPASWDATTITFAGASGPGLPPGEVYREWDRAEEAAGLRQAIEMTALADSARDTCECGEPIPRLRFPARADHDIIARGMTAGWPHLLEIRCAYPAAASTTPIPCGAVHRDPAATSMTALRASARAAGWHPDAFGRWACPRCGQGSGEYRTPYPLTFWAGDSGTAWRGEMRDYHAVYGGEPVLTPDGQILTVAAEHVLAVRAERDLRERTLRHYDNSHKRGVHADGAR